MRAKDTIITTTTNHPAGRHGSLVAGSYSHCELTWRSSDTRAFVLGACAVWTASQPEMLGGELTDLWPLLQNDMRGFIDNMTFIDCA